jgi:hypothetical protein
MIYHEVEGRSEKWFALRLGIPTSSEFHKIITPKKLQLSSQAAGLMYRLLAEWITGAQVENFESEYMVRGTELEDKAVLAYEMLTDTETSLGGFITTDDGMLGCSPDRLIGTEGDLEIKCPLIQTQVGYALTGEVGEDYMTQLQGRLFIHGRQWVDIFSYHPRLSIPPLRIVRNEKFIAALQPVLEAFVATILDARKFLDERFGPFVREAPVVTDEHPGALGITDDDLEAIILANDNLRQGGF